jgi:hypothetical protein
MRGRGGGIIDFLSAEILSKFFFVSKFEILLRTFQCDPIVAY